ncbi:hypothetical protein [[Flexibacter] sp. ATCC 35103]|uniref:hypothetical protein n=1 Tax=[Flexibacter] sp. ATCC 35103 TaxID=1937528 RepID=UPI0009C4CA2D|nr:hypothetical protein [[Flexibacter] sp. ATCC 35103]OMQ13549.1 hypothetical protein BXU01_03465 [[Flexibacter] sp. ATCC 35103]
MKQTIAILFILFFFSCKSDVAKKEVVTNNFQLDVFLKKYVSKANTGNDTIYLKNLNEAISLNTKKDQYQYSVEKYGDLFHNRHKYIQIINLDNNEYSIYVIKNKQVKKLISFEKTMELYEISIYDINGDGLDDFVLVYQTTGPKLYHFYLLNKNGDVAKEIKTYNYFPIKNKEFIQALNFRSPIVELKKMKWKEIDVDTIERIYYNWEHPVYYKSQKYPFKDFEDSDKQYIYDSTVKVEILKKLPPDYIKAVKKYYPRFDDK